MQRFVVASLIFVCVYIPDLGQKKISAYQTTATAAKFELSSAEFIAATWATNGLAYRLVDDAMFRKQFGSSIPPGFTRRTLSSTMETLARHGALSIPDPAPEALSYWFELAVHVPLLSKVAVAIFSITPSEACVERSFSAQGLVHSDLRSNLETVQCKRSCKCE